MDYVPGVPITDYCDQKRLKTRERLELSVKVCEGVSHAHQILQESSGLSWGCVLPKEQPRDLIKNLSPKFWWQRAFKFPIDIGVHGPVAPPIFPRIEGDIIFTSDGYSVVS